ncbi:hypothetical protein FRUB_08223 [Fimbriiglobus ruber]|uniref:Uncharacterized protein n=2 Tax=Fimbriiglobus ruber TaxID=1908690 RepID=A0A225D231_9BACT|nr:hypothetical protein FRUB_08223 [Fimbriiglobus ruber]
MPSWQGDGKGNVVANFGTWDGAMITQWANWFVSAGITGTNVFTAFKLKKLLRGVTLSDNGPSIGAGLTGALGLANYITYAFECAYNPKEFTSYKIGNGLLLGSNALQLLRILPPITPWTKFAHCAKLGGDFVCDFLGAALRCYGAIPASGFEKMKPA